MKIVGFDAPSGTDEQIKSGLISIAIAQKPFDIGYYAVKYAADAARGKKIPTYKSTGFVILDKNNISQPAMAQYIYSN